MLLASVLNTKTRRSHKQFVFLRYFDQLSTQVIVETMPFSLSNEPIFIEQHNAIVVPKNWLNLDEMKQHLKFH